MGSKLLKSTNELQFKKYKGGKGKIGGQHYDITKMSSRERAGYSFDGWILSKMCRRKFSRRIDLTGRES